MDKYQTIKKKRRLMVIMMYLSPKAAQKIWSAGGYCDWIYIPEIKSINLWFFHKEVTGRKSTIRNFFLISLEIILRPWRQAMRMYLLNISSAMILR